MADTLPSCPGGSGASRLGALLVASVSLALSSQLNKLSTSYFGASQASFVFDLFFLVMVVQKDSVAEDWLFGGNILDFLDFFTAGSFTMLSPSAQFLDGSEGVRGQ
eukprot:CAMPEP_0194313188 /NCGR_PEP_ID=MMETSP0171-20130528/10090_1 /TAXON_ID=218684 /ORGANISM="Corethron pennatum, Strain L29A3" /LENGTH=105 /DNA_ID=CAMNT_0039068037 /DNA_START=369 /DNA_END=687 /DNA_ORIENTATION=-